MAAVSIAPAPRPLLSEAQGARVDRAGSYGGVRKCGSFRLPGYVVGALQGLFTGDYAELHCSWNFEVDGWGGAGDARERVHLFDAEAHCDRVKLLDGKGVHEDVTRARETLVELAEAGDVQTVAVLRRRYGRPNPAARWGLFPEIAGLVDLCPTVIALAEAREAARQAEARRRFEAFWTANRNKLGPLAEKARALHLARIAGGAPLDLAGVVRDALDAHVHRLPGEGKAAFAARRIEKNAERTALIAAVLREGDALLADASQKFRAAWGDR